MSLAVDAPSASDSPVELADWLEMAAVAADDQNSSMQDLLGTIRRSGSIEAIVPTEDPEDLRDRGSERIQSVAQDALNELDGRAKACGGSSDQYPFQLGDRDIQAIDGVKGSIYLFLLLLSQFGKDAGPKNIDAAELFEEVSAAAAQSYFGGTATGVRTYLFGFPRRINPSGFGAALDQLCDQLGEGGGAKARPATTNEKDGRLDLAVWLPFADGKAGKMLGFGQCATGQDWRDKLTEMHPRDFCGLYMLEFPAVEPVRLFFTPFCADPTKWLKFVFLGGILFDRCRIASHSVSLEPGLKKRAARWTNYVLRHRVFK